MKNLEYLFNECKTICNNLDIPYREASISYNKKLTKKWGYCKKLSDSRFVISISAILGEENSPDKAIKSVILHELLHTCPGCFNHGKKWKEYGKRIKKEYGIKIKTTSDAEDMNIKSKYTIKCIHCGIKIKYPMRPRNTHGRCVVCNSKKLKCYKKENGIKTLIWKNL